MKTKSKQIALVSIPMVERRILLIRGQKVLLDSDLADLYGVETKRLNEAVKRNSERFPTDFMFKLTEEESQSLRSQFATLETSRGKHKKYLPYVFTEYGALMLANTLKSERAVQASIAIVRAFVQLRETLTTNKELAKKLNELEKKYNKQFVVVFNAIRQLMTPPKERPRKIGFNTEEV